MELKNGLMPALDSVDHDSTRFGKLNSLLRACHYMVLLSTVEITFELILQIQGSKVLSTVLFIVKPVAKSQLQTVSCIRIMYPVYECSPVY